MEDVRRKNAIFCVVFPLLYHDLRASFFFLSLMQDAFLFQRFIFVIYEKNVCSSHACCFSATITRLDGEGCV